MYKLSIAEFRQQIRGSEFTGHTSGYFMNKAQVNVVIMQDKYAHDFAQFCAFNPTPCPVVYRSNCGEKNLIPLGDIDITRDVPVYNIYRHGLLHEQLFSIEEIWQDDFVCFCIGCSFTFDKALVDGGVHLKHLVVGNNVAMYKTCIPLKSHSIFSGEMVVSMRWIRKNQVDLAVELSAHYPNFHGAPIHIGSPKKIGISTIEKPDYGEFTLPDGDSVPVFWGCGVTAQECMLKAELPIVITHKPGSMLLTDLSNNEVINKIKR